MIAVVDYGMGNIASLVNMFRRLTVPTVVAATPKAMVGASGLVIPGVGAFDAGIREVHTRGFADAIKGAVYDDRIPVLGICLGMQLLLEGSEEGVSSGLGIVPGVARRFPAQDRTAGRLRVPHVGWAELTPVAGGSERSDLAAALLPREGDARRFYFVHSYYADCANAEHVLATAEHGVSFAAAIGTKNVIGTQFHPEKSLGAGMALLARFAGVCLERESSRGLSW